VIDCEHQPTRQQLIAGAKIGNRFSVSNIKTKYIFVRLQYFRSRQHRSQTCTISAK